MTEAFKLPSVPGYVVEALVGRGGAADVWRARVARSGDVVALKRVHVHDAAQLATARAEAALLAALDHPNLVRLHEVVPIAGAAVLVLDYAAGGSLARLIRARGRLTPGEVITALAPIGAALASAHDAAAVHGDVSAANVLFTDTGHPLLSDLGVARLVGERGPVFGTPSYVDPAVASGAPPGPPSDVFMLAGVALHALTGSPTWPDANAEDALERARSGELDEALERLLAADVPEEMRTVVSRGLSPDPRRRGTAAEFALDLRHCGRPVAVELAAGRQHQAVEPSAVEPSAVEPSAATRTSAARPGSPKHAAPPPTRLVAPRARPVLPRRPEPAARQRRVLVAAAATGVAALGGAVLVWAPWRGSDEAAAITPVGIPSLPTERTSSSGTGTASDGWVAALDALDARRAQAYERRDARLLDDVYADPRLRADDAATLSRLVPRGCGLFDVRTSYSAVTQVEASAARAVLVVSAKLGNARLVCSGKPRSTTPPSAATRLRIELARSAHGVRIVRQQLVSSAQP